MQSALRLIYPTQCITCGDRVDASGALCGACWRDTPFISGTVCDCCGAPLLGEDDAQDVRCDACRKYPPVWGRGRAAFLYEDNARNIVLGFKHGDRQEYAIPAGRWMARAAEELVEDDTIVAPVPLHWSRFLKRRYNQSALLSAQVAKVLGLEHCPDLLRRVRKTRSLDGLGPQQRSATVSGAIAVHPKRRHLLEDRPVLLVDDVLTTGATLNSAAEACFSSRACDVNVITLARVAHDDYLTL
ncbi:double zinc ribbon domain-containing protein [Falsihalocynthiibacter sp. SS001]|uniref:double zinc ribbon domain-containing protein n=1 Tax=Falsihalocynthiibacter sp. SS001 TaxID=3349698 RepID=UPI0036D3EBC6